MNTSAGLLESRDDFKPTPHGQYKYWQVELSASERNLRTFIRQGNKIVARYLDSETSPNGLGGLGDISASRSGFNLNLFYSNTTTLMATLYGSVPTVDVSRRYADSSDDVGRVAAEIMERLLNIDIADNGSEIEAVLRANLQDRLTVGLGVARVRYDAEFTDDTADSPLIGEKAIIEYCHWRDVRWGWARDFSAVPWIGFRSFLTKDEVTKRFDEKVAEGLTYKVQQALSDDDSPTSNTDNSDAWQKAEIWEIWDISKREVVWVSHGYDKVLDTKPDPLQLTGFYPCPPFFLANATTTLYVPTADFHLSQDLYNEIDRLQTRISIITTAVKVVGVYDGSNGEIARMMTEGTDNDLIPVDNWAMFSEKGGIQGQIDWFPIGDVVAALTQLITIRDQTIALLQQITGMSDLMRGELSNQYEGVGQTQMKAQFGSVRIQSLQDTFATYVTDLMQIKAEVIARHCEPTTIAALSNATSMIDQELIEPAIMLIKKPEVASLKVNIRPETIALVDYAKLKNERTEFITALATFMQSAAPLMEMEPQTLPYLLQLLQWGMAGFKGASEIEGVLDKAIEEAQKKAKAQQEGEQPPTPEQIQQQMLQQEQQFAKEMEEFKANAEMQKIQAKAQADIAIRKADLQSDIQTLMAESKAAMELQQVEMIAALTETKAKMQADIQKEMAQAQANILQTKAAATAETIKDTVSTQLEIGKEQTKVQLEMNREADKTGNKIAEIEAGAQAKIDEIDRAGANEEGQDNE